MAKLFGRENKNSNFHNFFLEVQNNPYTFLKLRQIVVGSISLIEQTSFYSKRRIQQYLSNKCLDSKVLYIATAYFFSIIGMQ